MEGIKVLNRLQEGILIFDKLHNIIFCNECLLEKLKYDKHIIGQNIRDIFFERADEQIDTILSNVDKQVILILKNSLGLPVSMRMEVILEEDVYYIIAKELEMKDASNYTKEELEYIIDLMPYAVWIEDFKGKYRFVNQILVDEVEKVSGRKVVKENLYGMDNTEIWCNKRVEDSWCKDNEDLLQKSDIRASRNIDLESRNYKYTITKIPIRNSAGSIEKVIGIRQRKMREKYIEAELANEYKKYLQLTTNKEEKQETEKKDKIVVRHELSYILGAESIAISEYNEENGRLEIVSRIGGINDEIRYISMTKEEYKGLLEKQVVWKIDEYEKRAQCTPERRLRDYGIKYLAYYPIKYDSKEIGILIATYKEEVGIESQEVIMEKISRNIAILMKNIKLSNEINKELQMRKTAQQQVNNLLQMAVGLYSVYSPHNGIKVVNPGWKEILGWEEKNVMGHKWLDLIMDEDRAAVVKLIEEIKQGKEIGERVCRFKCKDGGFKWIRWKLKLMQQDQDNTYLMIGTDVTESVNYENERRAYREALKTETLKNEFLTTMSHELKTPLNIIYNILKLMQLKGTDGEYSRLANENPSSFDKYGKVIRQNIFRLLRLINNIVDVCYVGEGNCKINLKNYNIVQIIEEITMSVVEYVKSKNISIIFDTEIEELVMACDADKMERIILNLLSNAVKYGNPEGHIWVNLFKREEQLIIEVKDDGIGIPKEKQDSIFSSFVQVDKSLTRKCEGSGMGLTLVKALVEMHEGNISVESEIGKGSTFRVALPIRKVEEDEIAVKPRDYLGIRSSRVEKCCIEFSDIYN